MTSLRKTLPVAGLKSTLAFAAALTLVAGLAPTARASQLYAYSEQTISNLTFATTGTGTASIVGAPLFTSAASAAGPGAGAATTGTTDTQEAFTGAAMVNPGQNFFGQVGNLPGNDYARGDVLLATTSTGSPLSTVAETSYGGPDSSAGSGNYAIRLDFTVTGGSITVTPSLTYSNALSGTTGGSTTALARASYGFELSFFGTTYDQTPGVLNNVITAPPDVAPPFIQSGNLTLPSVTLGPGSYSLSIIGDSIVSTTQIVSPGPTSVTPEPATLASAGIAALFGLAYLRRTRRKATSA